LSAIFGYTRLLRSGSVDREEINKTTAVIERSVKVQLQIIEDLLDSARIVTGKLRIEPEFPPFVFDRFRQADSSSARRFGGLGLGLSLVKHLVELHGRTITAAGEGVRHGAMFTITLPHRYPEFMAPPVPAVVSGEVRTEGAIMPDEALSLKGVSLLVVDDQGPWQNSFIFATTALSN
jgi:signal transduction histidine kinase